MCRLANILFYFSQHPSIRAFKQENLTFFPSMKRLKPFLLKLQKRYTIPVFIMDFIQARNRVRILQREAKLFWKDTAVAYSFKTNYAPIAQFHKIGVYAEVTSERELDMALRFGYPGNKIIFNGPYKSAAALQVACKNDVLIQVDHLEEFHDIDVYSKLIRKPIRIGCRLHIPMPGRFPSHFGLRTKELLKVDIITLLRGHKFMRFEGIHFHIGTDIEDVSIFESAARYAGQIMQQLENSGLRLTYVNCGGGLMSHGIKPMYKKVWKPYSCDEYIRALWNGMHATYPRLSELTLLLESGRYLVDDATVFVTKALRVQNNIKQSVYVDGSTAMLPLVHYRPPIIRVYDYLLHERKETLMPTIIYGATCREDDILFRGWLPQVMKEDFLIFYCVGAYNESLGANFIYTKPRTYILTE